MCIVQLYCRQVCRLYLDLGPKDADFPKNVSKNNKMSGISVKKQPVAMRIKQVESRYSAEIKQPPLLSCVTVICLWSAKSHMRHFLLFCLESRYRWYWKSVRLLLTLCFKLVPPRQTDREGVCVCYMNVCVSVLVYLYDPVFVCLSVHTLHVQCSCVFLLTSLEIS